MYFRRKQSQGRIYLQIVESHRSGDRVRQRVIATLGRLDELEASGQLDRLLRSGARFVQQAMVLDAARTADGIVTLTSDGRTGGLDCCGARIKPQSGRTSPDARHQKHRL
jgi:hypothetical protein